MSDPRHSYRYPQARYEQAKAKAESVGTTVSEIITERLDELIDGPRWLPLSEPPDPLTRESFIGALERLNMLSPEKAAELRAETERIDGLLDQGIDELASEPVGETVTFAFHDDQAQKPDSACRSCDDCPGFRPQKKSPLRCECGDIQGVHP